ALVLIAELLPGDRKRRAGQSGCQKVHATIWRRVELLQVRAVNTTLPVGAVRLECVAAMLVNLDQREMVEAKEPVMKNVRFVGLDVHADTIAVAVAEQVGEVRSLGVIPNRSEAIRKLVKKLGPAEELRVCYEAAPTGYVVYWELTGLGVKCEVVAPTLVPVKAGDRVKTDRRDALKLARSYRAGDLTAVWVP